MVRLITAFLDLGLESREVPAEELLLSEGDAVTLAALSSLIELLGVTPRL